MTLKLSIFLLLAVHGHLCFSGELHSIQGQQWETSKISQNNFRTNLACECVTHFSRDSLLDEGTSTKDENQCNPVFVDCTIEDKFNCYGDDNMDNGDSSLPPEASGTCVCRVECAHVIKEFACDPESNWMGPGLLCGLHDIARPTIGGCPGNITVTSQPLGRSAVVSWKSPSGYDGGGDELQLKHGGPSSGSRVAGQTTVHYIAVDKHGNVAACSFTVSVIVLECPRLTPPRNALLRQKTGYPLSGSRVEYTCFEGFSLRGDRYRRCEQQRGKTKWSGHEPMCVPMRCKALDNPRWGMFSCTSGSQYQSLCTLTCYEGFGVPPGFNSIVLCKENGHWDGGAPYCADITPPSFENCPDDINAYVDEGTSVTRVTWPSVVVTDNSHETIEAHIIQGKDLGSLFEVGHHVIKYQATDSATNHGYCQFTLRVIEASCTPIKPLPHQRVACPYGYRAGAVCTLSCRYGYKLEGPSTVTCVKQQNSVSGFWDWNGGQPTCTNVLCPPLQSPNHGRLLCDLWGHKRLCRVECDEGYEVPRDYEYPVMQFVCSPAGSWTPSAEVPDCIASKEPRSGLLPSELYYYSKNCSDRTFQKEVGEVFLNKVDKSLTSFACTNQLQCYLDELQIKCEPLRHMSRLFRRFLNFASSERTSSSPAWQQLRMGALQDHFWNLMVVEFKIKVKVNPAGSNETRLPPVTVGGVFDESLHQMAKLIESLVMAGNLSLPALRGVSNELEKESFTYGRTQILCDRGLLPRFGSYSCASCGTGSYYNSTLDTCVRCPIGYYQNLAGQFTCTRCKAGTSTADHGARNASQCLDLCKAGYYSTNGLEPCSMCERGTYQNKTGQLKCQPCDVDKTTLQMGMTSQDACTGFDLTFSADEAETFPLLTHALGDDTRLLQFSMSFWMQVVNASENSVIVACVDEIRNGTDSALLLFRNAVNLEIKTARYTVLTNMMLEYQRWHHLMILWDGLIGKWSIYKDGILLSSNFLVETRAGSSLTGSADDNYLVGRTYTDSVNGNYISRSVAVGGPSFVGDVTNLYIWDRLLEPVAIWQLSASCGFHDSLPSPAIVWSDFVQTLDEESAIRTPSMCDDMNECESQPCEGLSTCIDKIGGFDCTCQKGLTGPRCEVNIDDCIVHACQNGATCVDGYDKYTCQCAKGFKGSVCEVQIKNGRWSEWSEWALCSRTCGQGEKTRWRQCDNPSPDPEGEPCRGQNVSVASCGESECPACQTPHRPLRGYLHCDIINDEEYNCNISCRQGYRFSTPVAKQYFCGPNTGYRWSHEGPLNPRARFPACTEIDIPDELVVNYQLRYPGVTCGGGSELSDARDSIDDVINENLNDIECVQEKQCKIANVNIGGCRQKRETDEMNSIVVDVQISKTVTVLPKNDSNKTDAAYQNLMALKSAIVELENAAATIRNKTMDKSFDVIVNGHRVSVDYNQSEPEGLVTCQSGMVRNQVFCVKCAVGTFYQNGECLPCPIGHYQDQEGQLACMECPGELTTDGQGSSSVQECIEITTPSYSSTDVTNFSEASSDGESDRDREIFGEIPFLLTFISIPILIFIIVMAIFMCRCWRRQGRLVVFKKTSRKRGDKTLSLRDRVVLKYDPVTGTEKGETTDEDEYDESHL